MEYILLLNPLHSFVLWEGEYIVEYILGGEKSCGIYCARGEILQNILWDVEYMLLTLCEAEYTLGGWIYCEMYYGIYYWLWKMMWDIFWEIFCNILWDVEYMLPLNPIHSFALWELLFCCCTVCSAHGTWICFSHFCASFSFLLLSVACILFFVSHTYLLFSERFLAAKKVRSWRKICNMK